MEEVASLLLLVLHVPRLWYIYKCTRCVYEYSTLQRNIRAVSLLIYYQNRPYIFGQTGSKSTTAVAAVVMLTAKPIDTAAGILEAQQY